MKLLTRIPYFFTVLALCALSGAAQQTSLPRVQQASAVTSNKVQLVIEGKVIDVHDGDTITVLDQANKKFHIRLQGIDAPELKQEFGSVSQQNLSRLVLSKQVTIVWTKVDKYRRTVGTIMLDGHDVNIEQVKAGLAWHFKKYEDEQNPEDRRTYAAAEVRARAAKLGLWQDPDPTPPGDWRAGVKTKRWGAPPPAGTIIGNQNSKKYHRPDCAGYRDMAEKNRVFFKTVEEAEAAGYKRAGNCSAEVQVVATKSSVDTLAIKPTTSAPAKTTSVAKIPVVTTLDADGFNGKVLGNKNSHIYHLPACPGYKSVSEKNRILFDTEGQAEQAGYRRAKNCVQGH
jgi:endonuclease YncB( thermonuclease family)/methylphosphotriester-DNA--protein-cysteine methyltransferase